MTTPQNMEKELEDLLGNVDDDGNLETTDREFKDFFRRVEAEAEKRGIERAIGIVLRAEKGRPSPSADLTDQEYTGFKIAQTTILERLHALLSDK